MGARIFLSIVGLAYFVFSAWCSFDPKGTSSKVGFDLRPGTGQSEYIVVYSGLQLALGCIFLLPWVRPEYLRFSLLSCLIVHASLVFFRIISRVLYGRFENTTYALAGLELALFLVAAFFVWKR